MPFLDHLEELRWRIIWSLAGLMIGFAIGFFVTLKFDLVGLLARPVLPLLPTHELYYTHPSEGFSLTVNVAMWLGAVLAAPWVIWQAWLFLAPALHRHERRLTLAVLAGGVGLFLAGAALSYFVVIPLSLPWLMGFGGHSLTPLITANDYFGFAVAMILTFGISFELPMVILALATLGLVTPAFLKRYRRHAIVVIVVIGAFLTPGDLFWTTIALAVPLYGLFELSVLLSTIVYRRRASEGPSGVAVEAG
ncbi:MAG TPA: twin-arginine translocase subunit TatC [Gemmatimonadaceae bacterium]|nr:twin-arginine translocase subunit TatC [Gemmatimonadaceae bacterium]